MKPTHTLRKLLLAAGSSLLAVSSASAQLYWDTNGTDAGFGTASGTWGTDAFWNTSATGEAGTFSSATTTSDALNFGTASAGLGAGTINVGTVEAASLTYGSQSGAILLSGGTITLPAEAAITNNATALQTINSTITGAGTSLTKAGGGSVRLSSANSSYTGATIINAGLHVTTLANGGQPSSIGASSSDPANLVLGSSATLLYEGSGAASTDRRITNSGGNNTTTNIRINASGGGALTFTNSAGFAYSSTNAIRGVVLTGNSTHENTLGYDIANNDTRRVEVTKQGVGTWVLTGTNTTFHDQNAASRLFRVDEGLLIFRGKQSIEDAGVLEVNKAATADSATARIESDSSFTMSKSGIRTFSTGTLQLDRQTAGSGDGLTFTMSNATGSSSQHASNAILNIAAGPNITAGTTPTLDVSEVGAFTLQNNSTATHTINASGANIRINGITVPSSANTRVKTLTLGGTSTGNEIYGAIDEISAGHTINVIKQGTGIWTFSGANLYNGTTTVSEGTLALVGGSQNSAITVNDSATLRFTLGSPTTSTKAVTLNSGSKIAITGTPTLSSYVLMTATSFSGTPVLDPAVTGYSIEVQGGTTLVLVSDGAATPYEIWAGPGVAFDGDANGDGISNGLAFLLGATGPNVNALDLLPTVTQTSGNLVLSFNMLKPANRGTAILSVEHSRDLGIADPWTTVPVTDTNSGPSNGVTFVVGSGAGTTNPVTATINASEAGGTGKLFGRLKGQE